ncbi:SDR family NAD(P)-dependent oxidoreductase [Iamia majanohamensis]|uniref:SDR family NAD(P)-dependent oxidoreductase n=1 Tax=Iamia majanohamensis TaxID=467976 RepID=A0AAE9Y728_9ACTN|nr:SDR family NAD(P)-dependent oxidoreductase [Iamia majanohamensis]WCO65578.1 SDR family NAD(P)-dependent oxidoreductase [Iamia majanohamensis]
MAELPPLSTPLPGPRLAGRSALVTGGASGIGAATALRLAAEGATVLAVDLDAEGLKRTAAALPAEATGAIAPHVADVSDEGAVGDAVAAAVEQGGGLDVVANIAGILRAAHSTEHSLELWDQVIRVNLTSTFLVCRTALPPLLDGGGVIVNSASTSAEFGHPWMAAYAASKGGVAALTHSLAVEYAKRGVRVNAIAPGSVRTSMTKGLDFPADADFDLLPRIMSPTGPGDPASVAAVVAMLASDDGAHITGEVIRIDGGTHS